MALFHHAFKHVLITVVLTLASARLAAQPLAYVKQYQQTVIALSDSFGIPAELIMGIALVESGAGSSQVCKNLHNHFGIKASKHYQNYNGFKSRFKFYETDSLSFVDFCAYVKRRKYYAQLKGNFNYNAWLNAMAKSGYSGSPKAWKSKIRTTIKKYNLVALHPNNANQQQP